MDQYAINRFAKSLELIPRILASNAGFDSSQVRHLSLSLSQSLSHTHTLTHGSLLGTNIQVIASLYAAHSDGQKSVGVDVLSEDGSWTLDAAKEAISDLYLSKYWAIKFAAEAAATVLRVDQIIMARMAGGPKPQAGPGDDD